MLRREERGEGELWLVTLLPDGREVPSGLGTLSLEAGGSPSHSHSPASEKTTVTVRSQSSKLVGIWGGLLKQLRGPGK